MISLQQMKYIIALDDLKQFQAAADFCNVTQPTLSMQLKKAEIQLNNVIFDRDDAKLSLTKFGKSLLPIIRNTIDESEKINILIEKSEGKYQEILRIGIIPTISAYMVTDMFEEWKKILPNVQLKIIELRTEQLLESIKSKEIDCGILAGDFEREQFRVVPVFLEEIMVYTSLNKKTISTDDLIGKKPWLLNEGNCLRNQMINFCNLKESANDSQTWDFTGGNMEILNTMVDNNGGYTLIPKNYANNKTNKNSYKTIKSEDGKIPARQNVCIFPHKTHKFLSIEKIIRSLQLKYNEHKKLESYSILPWK